MSNDWIGVQGDLVNQDTGEVTSFYEEISYYYGRGLGRLVDRGQHGRTEYLSAVDPGTYVLRTTAAFSRRGGVGGGGARSGCSSPVVRREARGSAVALVMLLIGPLFAFIRSSSFESTRWAESNLSSSDS